MIEECVTKKEFDYVTKNLVDNLTKINLERVSLEDEVRDLRKRIARLESFNSLKEV
jgi:hypothetical protein